MVESVEVRDRMVARVVAVAGTGKDIGSAPTFLDLEQVADGFDIACPVEGKGYVGALYEVAHKAEIVGRAAVPFDKVDENGQVVLGEDGEPEKVLLDCVVGLRD